MGRVAILKIGLGDFYQGFHVSLQIWHHQALPSAEIEGKLPPNPGIEGFYIAWQTRFRSLRTLSRKEQSHRSNDDDWQIAPSLTVQRSVREDVDACRQWVQLLENNMKTWLKTSVDESWQRIRERLGREFANHADEIRLVIQAGETQLWKLPWHVWDLLEQYPDVGISFSLPEFERPEVQQTSVSQPNQVRILAVLGDSSNLNLQPDQEAIRGLEGAETVFLEQPQAQELIRKLRDKNSWDIFFFAGHSQTESDTGRIYLNDQESLTIDQFKHALQTAIHQGLKIAIFNSCDGLGLAQKLANLQIPVVIVMQEVVPDQVAQSFLKEFLREYSQGQPLYTAVRRAQESLEEFQELPGATWLPVICQNPAEVPPTWEELLQPAVMPVDLDVGAFAQHGALAAKHLGDNSSTKPKVYNPNAWPFDSLTTCFKPKLLRVFLTSIIVTGLVIAVRSLGLIQTWELQAFDHLMRRRPVEEADRRLLIIGADERDISEDWYGHPLPDEILTQLLSKLQQHQPSVIGLDIVRDQPVEPGYQALVAHMEQNKDLIAICALGKSIEYSIAPPPQIPETQVGFVDLYNDSDLNDQDDTIRRYLLSRTGNALAQTSRCSTSYSLSWNLAYRYFKARGISVEATGKDWKFGSVIIKRLQSRSGGYQKLDAAGNQLLLNYRNIPNISQNTPHIAQQVTVRDVLTNSDNFDPAWVQDRVVLIGVTAASIQDDHGTPYGKMRGLYIHAHAVSQILSAVEDNRPLLWWWPQWGDGLWIGFWSLAGGVIVWYLPGTLPKGVAFSISVLFLYGCCWFVFTKGGWIPLVPSVLALIGTGGIVELIIDN
ncbi:MAG: CHASE2 domain-containing protein [Symploca sp. SIO3E6]|nr:CHASE2 domain-containing protein [Caldora sp. SIO3E6]